MHELTAGSLTATVRDGELRDVRALGWPVLDACYVTVRDENWRTVGCRVNDMTVSGDRVVVSAVHDDGGAGPVTVRWTLTVTASDDDLLLELAAVCERDFDSNRIGFCLLHPQRLRGRAVTGSGPDGAQHNWFGPPVSPDPVLSGVDAMHYAVADGLGVRLTMTGDLFEIEDHRNWSDPGWKTYCTPLTRPRPVHRHAGERIVQSIRLRTERAGGARPRRRADGSARLGIGDVVGMLPVLTAGATLDRDVTSDGPRPAAVHVELEQLADWQTALDLAADEARALSVPLDAWLVAEPAELPELTRALLGSGCRLGRIAPFSPTVHTTEAGTTATVRQALGAHGGGVQVGGGTRGHLAELNRGVFGDDTTGWDFVTYGVSPEVHHCDVRSVLATVTALADGVEQARRVAGERPVVVGPITMRPRFPSEQAAANPMPVDDDERSDVDARLHEDLGATYLAGAVCTLARASALIAFRGAGRRGLQPRAGVTTPVSRLAADVMRLAGRPVRAVDTDDEDGLVAVAVDDGSRRRMLAVNLDERPRAIVVGSGAPTVVAGHGFIWKQVEG